MKSWIAFLFVTGCTTLQIPRADQAPRDPAGDAPKTALIVLTLDGVSYQELETFDPAFLHQQNVQPIRPPLPSWTFPGHCTIATGVDPKVHGIDGNYFSAPPDQLRVKPVWTEAAEKHLQVRTYMWPLSYGPWHGIDHHADKIYEPFDGRLTFNDIALRALQELNSWDQKENLLFMARTPGLDAEGHKWGPYADATRKAWSQLGPQIVEFEHAIEQFNTRGMQVQVLFLSDHGMADIKKCNACSISDEKDCAKSCPFWRKPTDLGFHGEDPAVLPEMMGVIWTYPSSDVPLPSALIDVRAFIRSDLELN